MTTAITALKAQPQSFTIVDPTAGVENVTKLNVLIGTVSGGPYPVSCTVDAADVTTEDSTGTATIPVAKLSPVPTFQDGGTYYAVANATNATGTGPNSPEIGFSIPLPLPSAPTSFSVA